MRVSFKNPRFVLYHGTSTRRLKSIFAEQRLRASASGNRKVAMTTNLSVAEYFAFVAVIGDWADYPANASWGVVLGLDGDKLRQQKYRIRRFRDPIYGEGECDWENEFACWTDIANLGDVLLSVERVPGKRLRKLIAEGQRAVHRRGDAAITRRLMSPEPEATR